MNVKEFQAKLNEICAVAEQTGGVLTGVQMREFFGGMELDRQQLLQILQYLKAKGVTIEGMEQAAASDQESGMTEEAVSEKEIIPLTPEEEAYLNEYRRELTPMPQEDLSAVFQAWKKQEAGAKEKLIKHYLTVAADLAVELNCEEIFIADLIQEANVSLLMALSEPNAAILESNGNDDLWLRRRIREDVATVVAEQTQRSLSDDMLVEKVQKLDTAIRELSEDEEDGESPFTIGELAVILDMKADEIKDILRLAGEDSSTPEEEEEA